MRIYRERVPQIARNIVKSLIDAEQIEVTEENLPEVELDVESVVKEYRRMDHEITEKARDLVQQRNVDYSQTFKIKAKLAQQQNFVLGDEAVGWICDQIVEILLQSRYVEEIFGEDHELRSIIAPILKRELLVDDELDREVKKRIRNLEEGTTDYEVEYRKTMEQLRSQKKGPSA
ncbi:MAG: DUF507 family protein [Myxococcales bacterium]|nr:DUF507 family protein [Myxococcales bacterium]MCB9733920.1 DUF507 family protein [Deltaproteobacteria bacterium]